MTHIVSAIGCEAARVRDDWETALLCAEAAERADEPAARPPPLMQDNYCFEMLSLVRPITSHSYPITSWPDRRCPVRSVTVKPVKI